jgi:hypothetical protein
MATLLKLPTSARRRIYQALVDQPRRHWTVRTLTDVLAAHASVKEAAVRDTINLLLSLRLVALVPHRCSMTISLTVPGERALIVALRRARAQKGV